MAENNQLVLSDKSIVPTDDYIFSFIGVNAGYWKKIQAYVSENCKDAVGTWNYYNDGKQWLFKVVMKKKTIFWAGILKETFRITFYLGDKAEPLIDGSDLPQNLKDGFRTAKRYGLIRPVSFIITDQSDVENVIKLIAIKSKIK